MDQTLSSKKWINQKGVLGYVDNQNFIIPSVDEIYSAVFENIYSTNVSVEDVTTLQKLFLFSKYPSDLKIILKSGDFPIEISIDAFDTGGNTCTVNLGNTEEHIVIKNTWYPFVTGAKNEICNTLESHGIHHLGKIGLGQYLSLLKVSNGQIINAVALDKLHLYERREEDKPLGIRAKLYPYQLKGWQWLSFMSNEKVGSILADEMGLGKTLQIISLIATASPSKNIPSLIVAPTTLLENWRREFEKFAPDIVTVIHQGRNRTGFPNVLKNHDVVITSYDTVVRDSSLFNQFEWKFVICDEAQAIKNPATKRSLSVKRIPRQTGIAVTGTPMENKLTDLWSILDFSVPGFLGDQSTFAMKFENTQDGPSLLQALISPLILRRKVDEVAKDLPAKIIIPQVIELNGDEIFQYEQIRIETAKEFQSNASLVILTRLRLFCCHPFLIREVANQDPAFYSNKYARLVELVEEIVANNAKVIVFTSFLKMSDIIVSDVGRRFDIYTNSIDGRTPASDRQNIVDRFSAIKGAALLVLNPIAAGTGLNITAANHVIHYNLEWNPAKEDQASARAHRRGQDRPVTIHRLFYANTVEEVIDERLTRKRALAGAAIVGVKGDEHDLNDILNAINKSPKHI